MSIVLPEVSPELALVDPELRATAIAGLPGIRPFAFLDDPPLAVVVPLVPARRAPLPRAVAAYLAIAVARTVVLNVAVLFGIAALVLIINFFA